MKSLVKAILLACNVHSLLAAPPPRAAVRAHDLGIADIHLEASDKNSSGEGGQRRLNFVVDKFETCNAREGDPFEAKISGLLRKPLDAKINFFKSNESQNAEWIDVSADGKLTGNPVMSSRIARLVVMATEHDGPPAQIEVTVPVKSATAIVPSTLSVLSYNLWFGGTQVNDYHNKQVRFLATSGVDIVGLQESSGDHAKRLGEALGWDYWQGDDVGIISRYPIVERYPAVGVGGSVRIALDQDLEVIVWSVHLGYDPYGPYDFCFANMTQEQVLHREAKSGRTGQIKEIIGRMQPQLAEADSVPVILMGDFNAPSHLDWIGRTRSLHCGVRSFPWPTSTYPIAAGMIDSFREVNQDPRAKPGITWSPIYLDNDGRPEPEDRIDFIYRKGKSLREYVSETVIVGQPQPEPNHQDNEWTSDHAAVKTIFELSRSF